MTLSPIEADAVATVDTAPILAQVEAWAAINSGTRNLGGLEEMAATLADAFAVLPGEVRYRDPGPVESVAADGGVTAQDHARHLTLAVRPDAPVQLLLTGHMDTVYPIDHAFQAVRRIDAATLGGPGVADMKGGLAVMLAALRAVETTPLAARIGYTVIVNSDEETGSLSSAALLAETARGKLAALTYEPALPDGTLAGARGGTGNFSIVFRGRSAHAGRNPEEGRNAVVAAADLALRLSKAAGDGLTVNPARIEGGGPNNVVPEHAVLHVNVRPADTAAIDRARVCLDVAVDAVAAAHDVAITVHGGFNRPPKPIDPAAARLFALVKDVGAALGLAIAWRATGGVCDGNNIAAEGVPVIDTMGVRGGAIHSPDEYMLIDSLTERAALSAVTILRLAERGRV